MRHLARGPTLALLAVLVLAVSVPAPLEAGPLDVPSLVTLQDGDALRTSPAVPFAFEALGLEAVVAIEAVPALRASGVELELGASPRLRGSRPGALTARARPPSLSRDSNGLTRPPARE